MDVAQLQRRLMALGFDPGPDDGKAGPRTRAAVIAALTNRSAPALTKDDIAAAASDLRVPVGHIKGVRKVEAPRGPFDDQGRPSILYEPHVFARQSGHEFNVSHPKLSYRQWKAGAYGPLSAQYPKLLDACALAPDAAFKACSWGAFQVLGENAGLLGYRDALDMAIALTKSEAAHLDSFVRFVRSKRAEDELRACRPGDPSSCEPFVAIYNGTGQVKKYAGLLAEAIA
ncbi:N-acetylmuramidase family protein [Sphingomonas sp. MG17]|uniref:N-acetylmuramidase family protein n=1 Tax=Sphingomonas tagetis TaxID=2949092 RepID=A0A9X2KMS7_9SPHN|nr:N-acetylmuramidase domain-containing protein [Sphingomonas tagetis]MCP3731997.1 N-acetylmuramidase family protein [Sphingomonas tagetis]